MSIINIRNKYARRAALVALVVPLVLFELVWALGFITVQIAQEVPDAFRSTWKGRL